MKQVILNKFHNYEIEKFQKINNLVELLTGLPTIIFLKYLTSTNNKFIEKIYTGNMDEETLEKLINLYTSNAEYWNNKRDWRKLDVMVRSLINGWIVEDATYYHLVNNNVRVRLNEVPRNLQSTHSIEPDLIVNNTPVEVMVHYYNFIQEENMWVVKKYKFDYIKKINGVILLYDLYNVPKFLIINPSKVEAEERKKLIGGKRGYIIHLNNVKRHPIGKLGEELSKLE